MMNKQNSNITNTSKVLIFGYDLCSNAGGGVTLRNIFHNFPEENILVANNSISEKCKKKYQYFEYRLPKIFGMSNGKFFNILINIIPFYFRFSFVNDLFTEWINKNKPQIIFALPHKFYQFIILKQILQKTDIPVYIYIVDDWIKIDSDSIYFIPISFRFNQLVRTVFKKSSKLICISEKMQSEYQDRYKKKFSVIHNPYIKEQYNQKKISRTNEKFRVLYAGSIENYNYKLLLRFGEALFNQNAKKDTEFDVYGVFRKDKYKKAVLKSNRISYKGFIKREELLEKIGGYDMLFLPMSFDPKMIKQIRLSMPTKITDYLASGIPVFLLAPDNIAVTEYAIKYKWAFVCTNINELQTNLTGFLNDEKLMKETSYNAFKLLKSPEIEL